jgi:tetratricopeptide (TPR) repeat protein
METGRIDEGLIEARQAVGLSPMSPSPNQTLGWLYYMGRQYDRAIQHFQRAIEDFPDFLQNYSCLGIAYEAKGMHREAIDVLQKAVKLTNGAPAGSGSAGPRSRARR